MYSCIFLMWLLLTLRSFRTCTLHCIIPYFSPGLEGSMCFHPIRPSHLEITRPSTTGAPLVARMTSVASLMYASPAEWDFTIADERPRLNCLLASLRRTGYIQVNFP